MADLRAAGDTGHQVSQQRVFGDLAASVFGRAVGGISGEIAKHE
jgi:hypothetical protein